MADLKDFSRCLSTSAQWALSQETARTSTSRRSDLVCLSERESLASCQCDQKLSGFEELALSLFDLYALHRQVSRLISLGEDSIFASERLKLGSHEFIVTILEDGIPSTSKSEIASLLSDFPSLPGDGPQEIELSMAEAYISVDHFDLEDFSSPIQSQINFRAKKQYEKLFDKLEWERSELGIIKSLYLNKEKELEKAKELLDKHRRALKSRAIQLEKDKDKFENQVKAHELEKKEFRENQIKKRQHVAGIKKELLQLMSENCDKDEEEILRKQITDLEKQLGKADSKVKDAIVLKLTRCRTQLAYLRSQKTISSTLKTSNYLQNTISKVEHKWESEDIKSSMKFMNKRNSLAHSYASGYLQSDYNDAVNTSCDLETKFSPSLSNKSSSSNKIEVPKLKEPVLDDLHDRKLLIERKLSCLIESLF